MGGPDTLVFMICLKRSEPGSGGRYVGGANTLVFMNCFKHILQRTHGQREYQRTDISRARKPRSRAVHYPCTAARSQPRPLHSPCPSAARLNTRRRSEQGTRSGPRPSCASGRACAPCRSSSCRAICLAWMPAAKRTWSCCDSTCSLVRGVVCGET